MPYKRIGKTVYVKRNGKWEKKSTAKTITKAKKMMNLLRAVKHGWKPTGKKKSVKRS